VQWKLEKENPLLIRQPGRSRSRGRLDSILGSLSWYWAWFVHRLGKHGISRTLCPRRVVGNGCLYSGQPRSQPRL